MDSLPVSNLDPSGLIKVVAVCSKVQGYDVILEEFPYMTGDKWPCPIGWDFFQWKSIPENPDQLIDNLCKNLNHYPRCNKCSCDQLKALLKSLKDAGRATRPVPIKWGDGSLNQCERWCEGFEQQHSVGFRDCVYETYMMGLSWCIFGGHAAIKIVLCDGSVLLVDNGIIGGGDFVGLPGEAGWEIGGEGPPWETILPNLP